MKWFFGTIGVLLVVTGVTLCVLMYQAVYTSDYDTATNDKLKACQAALNAVPELVGLISASDEHERFAIVDNAFMRAQEACFKGE